MRALITLSLLLMSTAAFAETAQGFYVAGGLMDQEMKEQMQSTEQFDGVPTVTINQSGSRYNTGGTLLAGYQLPLGANGVVMLEAGSDMASGTVFQAHGVSGGESMDVTWRVTRNGFVALKPGWQLSEGLVVYLSVAWHGADIDLSRTTFGSQNNTRTAKRTIGGTGIGLGIQGRISEHVFVRGEIENVQFARTSIDITPAGPAGSLLSVHSIKPEALVGRLLVGYRF